MIRPWGIQAIQDMYSEGVDAGLPDGRYVAAVAEPYSLNVIERVRAAWWVLTGRAHAMVWPKAGDLESVRRGRQPSREFAGKLNEPQMATVRRIRPKLQGAQTVDLIVRKDAQEHRFEADWLRHALDVLCGPLPSRLQDQACVGGIVGGVTFGEGLQAARWNDAETAA